MPFESFCQVLVEGTFMIDFIKCLWVDYGFRPLPSLKSQYFRQSNPSRKKQRCVCLVLNQISSFVLPFVLWFWLGVSQWLVCLFLFCHVLLKCFDFVSFHFLFCHVFISLLISFFVLSCFVELFSFFFFFHFLSCFELFCFWLVSFFVLSSFVSFNCLFWFLLVSFSVFCFVMFRLVKFCCFGLFQLSAFYFLFCHVLLNC